MNFKGILLGWIGINVLGNSDARKLAAPYTTIPSSEIKSIVGMVNKARSNVKVGAYAMPHVTWDYSLETALKQAVKDIDTEWWFGSDNEPFARYNSQMLMRYAPFNTSFPNYDFMIHDGCQSISTGLTRIFNMRAINQAKFFKYNLCSDTNTVPAGTWGYINSYFSCAGINKNTTKLVSNKPWSWMWQYYPKIVNDDMETFACMLLGSSGPNAAGGSRPNHFFCYWGNKSHPQVGEKPYVAVQAGQQAGAGCPGKVVNKLCM